MPVQPHLDRFDSRLHGLGNFGFDIATFSKSIGHSGIRTTMEIYAHLDMMQNRFVQRTMEDMKDF